ncbi:hypothetical protein BE20_13445 [Sorangium cellulosum]|uniref:Metallo-beta-lactamase domain-containing protein n=1 Tax=Sorangium cellulosum TaxID=56 RepID=A0A150S095_SORCE|nr:hypothetical protein BE18_13780 [Sorangium cellulosum]KYF91862.1 hypothetical protein BE20_13445 [Sorangium cellulosum]
MLIADELPRPAQGTLTVYLLGPGVGESEVIALPDGKCIVVDCCTKGGVNLPIELLQHLGIASVEAIVLTHPDLDHLRGIADVVRRFPPQHVFRYPGDKYVRDLVACWIEKSPSNARYRELSEAIKTIDAHTNKRQRRWDLCATTRPWCPAGAPYTIHFLAPTPFDRDRVGSVLRKVVQLRDGEFGLSERFERVLRGEADLGDTPNVLSLALVIEWAGRKVLLAGDVENGTSSPESGWKGVLALLDDQDNPWGPLGHLVEDVELVKVAHHGSQGAFFASAWARHAKSKKTMAMVAPYSPKSLPSDATLVHLRTYCSHLGISAEGGDAFTRAEAAGWAQVKGRVPSTTAHCVAAVLDPSGDLKLFRGMGAALFQ